MPAVGWRQEISTAVDRSKVAGPLAILLHTTEEVPVSTYDLGPPILSSGFPEGTFSSAHHGKLPPEVFAFDEMTHAAFRPKPPFAPPPGLVSRASRKV